MIRNSLKRFTFFRDVTYRGSTITVYCTGTILQIEINFVQLKITEHEADRAGFPTCVYRVGFCILYIISATFSILISIWFQCTYVIDALVYVTCIIIFL